MYPLPSCKRVNKTVYKQPHPQKMQRQWNGNHWNPQKIYLLQIWQIHWPCRSDPQILNCSKVPKQIPISSHLAPYICKMLRNFQSRFTFTISLHVNNITTSRWSKKLITNVLLEGGHRHGGSIFPACNRGGLLSHQLY